MAEIPALPIPVADENAYSRRALLSAYVAPLNNAALHVYGKRGRVLVPSWQPISSRDIGIGRGSYTQIAEFYCARSHTSRAVMIAVSVLLVEDTSVAVTMGMRVTFSEFDGSDDDVQTALRQATATPLPELGIASDEDAAARMRPLSTPRSGRGVPALFLFRFAPATDITAAETRMKIETREVFTDYITRICAVTVLEEPLTVTT